MHARAREAFVTTQSSNEQAAPAQQPERDFSWMRVPTQRGMKPAIGPQGLRLRDIDQGSYAYVPDHWPYKTDMPRGAFPSNQTFLEASYSLYDKCDVWSENAADLYEDAIRDRWSSATDVPWETLQPYDEIAERAFCQILTEISEASLVGMQIFSGWLERISYGFYEVKSYLATEIYDLGRHHEALRKRALANGGGLGIEPPNTFTQRYMEAMNFTEALLCIAVLEAAFQVVLFEAGDELAQNEAERELYHRCLGDKLRHLQYGRDHLVWIAEHAPQRAKELQRYLAKAEHALVADIEQPISSEPLIVLFGGGLEGIDRGAARLHALRRAQVARYLQTLREAGFDHADFPLHSHLAAFTEQPVG